MKNEGNNKKYENYPQKILQSQIMKTTNDMKKEMKGLFKFLFRAPANVRPGYRVTNSSTGFSIDPLTTSKIEKE